MIRKLSTFALAAMMVAFFATKASAQFEKDKNYLGARIGLGFIGSGVSLGADYERGITNPGEVGPGRIGIGGTIDYWGWSDVYWSYSWIPIAAMGYYHLDLENKNLDLFGGLGLGYEIVSISDKVSGFSYGGSYSSGVYFTGQLGIRYFFSPNLAVQGRLGFNILSAGVDYKF